MADIQDTDLFLVNRNNSTASLLKSELMAELLDDDLMLVNRNGKTFKATGADIKGSFGPAGTIDKPSIIAPADGASGTDAPAVTGLTIYSSAFSASPNSLLHTDSDWQITLETDTTFANPVDQVVASATNKTEWQPIELEEGVTYRCRVRYHSDAFSSEWSDSSTFTTKDAPKDVTATPGKLYRLNAAQTWTEITTPALCVNFASSMSGQPAKAGVTIEGGVAGNDTGTATSLSYGGSAEFLPGAGSNVIDYWTAYTGNYPAIGLRNDGTLFAVGYGYSNTEATDIPIPTGCERLVSFGGVKNMVGAISKDYKLYCLGLASHKFGSEALGGSDYEWREMAIGLPSGKTIAQVAAVTSNGYDVNLALILDSDGELWEVGQSSHYGSSAFLDNDAANTNANPKKVAPPEAGKVRAIATAASAYQAKWGYSILMENGNLYAEQGTGHLAFGSGRKNMTLIGSNFISCVIGSYESAQWMAGNDDGQIMSGKSSFVASLISQPPGAQPFESLGNAPGKNNSTQPPLVIIP